MRSVFFAGGTREGGVQKEAQQALRKKTRIGPNVKGVDNYKIKLKVKVLVMSELLL